MMRRGLPTARWQALGSTAVVRVAEPWLLEEAVLAVKQTLERFDRACSRFRADSELSAVNAHAGQAVEVSPLLQDAVETALRGAELTGGTLDPCLGRLLEEAGYDRDWELVRDEPAGARDDSGPIGSSSTPDGESPRRGGGAPRLLARRRGAWRELEVDRVNGTVRIPAGIRLDLGATAKSLAADRACAAAYRRVGHGVLVALGGDLAANGRAPEGGWHVHVTDDHRAGPASPGQRITIESGGLATSSTVTRRWRRGGETMHHIIDPVSGRPAVSRWRTVSVAAADCTDANIASTTALLRDGEALNWLSSRGLPARLVALDGTVRTLAGWPAAELALSAGATR